MKSIMHSSSNGQLSCLATHQVIRIPKTPASLKECAATKSSIISWRSQLRIRPIIAFAQSRPNSNRASIELIFDIARIAVATLACFSSPQVLEPWAKWTTDVMILAGKAVLSRIAQWVEFVAPFSCKIKPLGGSVGRSVRCTQIVGDMIVRVCE